MSLLDYHNFTSVGEGEPTLLFTHGFGCNKSMFRDQKEHFAGDYRVVLYDLAGSNETNSASFRKDKYQSLQGYADDLTVLIEEADLGAVVHIGHSVGATIGVLAANKRPDLFLGQVLIGPSPRYINEADYYGGFTAQDIDELLGMMGDNYLGWSAQTAPAIMGNAERPELGDTLTNSFCQMDPEIAALFARVTFLSDNRKDLKEVSIPTLILQTDEDILAPEVVGRYVHEQIAGSEFVLLEARGHCPHISAPAATNAAIRKFISQLQLPVSEFA